MAEVVVQEEEVAPKTESTDRLASLFSMLQTGKEEAMSKLEIAKALATEKKEEAEKVLGPKVASMMEKMNGAETVTKETFIKMVQDMKTRVAGFSQEGLVQMQTTFQALDADGSKQVSLIEFYKACQDKSSETYKSLVALMGSSNFLYHFKDSDADGDRKLDFNEFVQMVHDAAEAAKVQTMAKITDVFERLDADGSKQLSLTEFFKACQDKSTETYKDLCDVMGSQNFLYHFKDNDKNGDRKLDFQEFVAMVQEAAASAKAQAQAALKTANGGAGAEEETGVTAAETATQTE